METARWREKEEDRERLEGEGKGWRLVWQDRGRRECYRRRRREDRERKTAVYE